MFKSALFKLTLWYVLLAMALSLLFSFVIFHFAAVELGEGLNSQFKQLSVGDHDINVNINKIEYSERTDDLFNILVYFNLLVLVLSSIASYLLAKKTLRPIEAAHQSQIRFTAQASHELRSPIAAMMADTESVIAMKTDDSILLNKTLKANLKDLKRLTELANHLLEVARFRSSQPVARTDFRLDQSLNNLVSEFKRTIPKTASLKTSLLPIEINGDKVALELALSTILDNAVKYGQKNNSKVAVRMSQDKKRAMVEIEDNGPGIDPKEIPNIFDPFFRSEHTKNSAVKGHGLGLSLAKEIIDSHRGTIDITARTGGGSIVKISLPR